MKQTTRVNGKRVVITTSAKGKVTIKPAPILEIDLQIEAVKRLKRMPEYVSKAKDVRPGTFTLAADQNGSGNRSRNAASKFKAAGMAAGEPDIRLNFHGGVIRYIEMKGQFGGLTESQEERFPLLRALGFTIEVIEASTIDEAGDKATAIVRDWLAANDNEAAEKSVAAVRWFLAG